MNSKLKQSIQEIYTDLRRSEKKVADYLLSYTGSCRELTLDACEGKARSCRYRENNRYLIQGLKAMGFIPYVSEEHQGPIITTFFYPENRNYTFEEMYCFIKDRGYAIYPGKVTDAETFRIGNIGEIYLEDMERLCEIFREFLQAKGAAA